MSADRRFELWRRALLVVWAFTALFGVTLVLFDTQLIPGPFNAQVSEALWSQPALPPEVVTYHRFVHAVLGASLAGWGLCMLFVVQHPFRRRERWAWWCLLLGPTTWFLLDTGSSAYYGVWPNAVLNISSYIPLVVPLLFTRGAFRSDEREAPG